MTHELIGVLIETEDPELEQVLSPEMAKNALADDKDVKVFASPSWNGSKSAERINRLCAEEGLTKVVICGPSSETSTLPEWLGRTDDVEVAIPISYAAVRDHCARVETSPVSAEFKAERLLKMAIAGARGSAIPELVAVPVERSVAVIGGNHAAYQMASTLLSSGYPVTLIETAPVSGCFYPLSEDLVKSVHSDPALRYIKDATIYQITGCVGSFILRYATSEGSKSIKAGSVVLAVDAQAKPLSIDGALAKSGRVISLREYGDQVKEGRVNGARVCLWLDRDGPERRCAGRAGLETSLEHARVGGKPTVLFSNMPVYGHNGQVLYDDARSSGVKFIKYDGDAPKVKVKDASLVISVTDSVLSGRVLEFEVDSLVIPDSMTPSEENQKLSELLRQPLDMEGHLQSGNVRHRPVGSARRGVFFVGGCHDECDPGEAHVEALAVQAGILAALPEGGVEVPLGKAIIDESKCAKCLTCYRACPHGAIQLDPSGYRVIVQDAACYQCGICAAACPGRAIENSSVPMGHMHNVLEIAAADLQGSAPIIAFACRQSAIPAASEAGRLGLKMPSDVLLIDVPCAGQVSENLILDAFEQGARGVLVLGCHHDNCRSLWGNDRTSKRVNRAKKCLAEVGIDMDRTRFHAFASNEAHRLANVLGQASEEFRTDKINE